MDTTNRKDDELLSAYIDGELAADDAAALVERLAREPALVQRLEAMRSGDAAVRAVYERLDDEPLPDSVTRLLDVDTGEPEASNVVELRGRGMPRFANWPVAMAASVALIAGFLSLRLMQDRPPESVIDIVVVGELDSGNPVYDYLETGKSGQSATLDDAGEMGIVLSFQADDGDYCRQLFVTSTEKSVHGVACKHGSDWTIEAVGTGAAPVPGGQFRPAAGDTPAAVSSAVDALIGTHDPLDADEESAMISAGWKKTGD